MKSIASATSYNEKIFARVKKFSLLRYTETLMFDINVRQFINFYSIKQIYFMNTCLLFTENVTPEIR